MKILKKENLNLDELVDLIKQGKTFVYPTETCYGLGADVFNSEAVKKIFKIKKRQEEKSVLILVSDLSMIIDCLEWNEQLNFLAEKYWPGAMTLVVKIKKNIFTQGIVAKDNTIAFRISSHPLVKEICQKLGGPIVSTSANISSEKSPYTIGEIETMFSDSIEKPDLIIDAGDLPFNSPSTIVSVLDGEINILRQGNLIIEN